ncbi:YeiH family protein [Oceanobacter mangrovi]|uniref:YeiH family protein n=1 Tax=Oceanobacter mangrovi TaxID=2862510 RepID=UPI001C8EACD1|nr:putative sulfate exporter family transporter [Oceanobacter mangrovi]
MLVVLLLVSFVASQIAGLSSVQSLGLGMLPLAILLGMLVTNLIAPVAQLSERVGGHRVLGLAQKQLLRSGIVLFGFNLTLADIQAAGWQAIVTDVGVITLVMLIGGWIGMRWLKMPVTLVILVSIGSAVCGAAAVMAAAPLLNRKQEHVGIAVAMVALFGTLSVLVYPYWLGGAGDAGVTGLIVGSTVHEVAQVVAIGQGLAANEAADSLMQTAVVVKLMRVLLLIPTLLLLAVWLEKRQPEALQQQVDQPRKLPIPWFVLGFLAVVIFNSLVPLPAALLQLVKTAALVLMTLAMVGLGLNTRWQPMVRAGAGPLILGTILWLLLMALTLVIGGLLQ